MFHSEKTDLRPASRIFSSETALDERAQSGRAFCPQLVSALCGRGGGFVRCPRPPALSPKVGEVPRRCPLRPVCPPALRVHPPVSIGESHVLVKSHLEQKSRGLGVGKHPLRSLLSFLT